MGFLESHTKEPGPTLPPKQVCGPYKEDGGEDSQSVTECWACGLRAQHWRGHRDQSPNPCNLGPVAIPDVSDSEKDLEALILSVFSLS